MAANRWKSLGWKPARVNVFVISPHRLGLRSKLTTCVLVEHMIVFLFFLVSHNGRSGRIDTPGTEVVIGILVALTTIVSAHTRDSPKCNFILSSSLPPTSMYCLAVNPVPNSNKAWKSSVVLFTVPSPIRINLPYISKCKCICFTTKDCMSRVKADQYDMNMTMVLMRMPFNKRLISALIQGRSKLPPTTINLCTTSSLLEHDPSNNNCSGWFWRGNLVA